jgi:small nuclear ribonucleoprotein (snRNP)-like protein
MGILSEYCPFRGKRVEIVLNDSTKLKGTLVDVDARHDNIILKTSWDTLHIPEDMIFSIRKLRVSKTPRLTKRFWA